MTLRQEIQNRIEIVQYADTEQIYPEEEAEKILKLFEKLIDENIKEREEYKLVNPTIFKHQIFSLKDLKEELSK